MYTRLESIPKPKTAYPAPNTPNPPVVVLVGAAVAGLRLLALFLLGHHECLLALVIHNVRGGVAARHKVTGFGFRVPGFGVSSYKMSAGTQPLYRLTCCRWWLELLARRVCLAYLKVQTRNPRARALSPRRTCARAHTHTHTLSLAPHLTPLLTPPLSPARDATVWMMDANVVSRSISVRKSQAERVAELFTFLVLFRRTWARPA